MCASTLYRGISLIRKRTPLGPYRRPMPRVLRGHRGVGAFLVPLYPLSRRIPDAPDAYRGTSLIRNRPPP